MAAQYFSCFFNQQQPHGEVLQGELAFFWLKHFMQKHKGIMRNQFYFVSVQLQHGIIYDVNSILSWKKTKKKQSTCSHMGIQALAHIYSASHMDDWLCNFFTGYNKHEKWLNRPDCIYFQLKHWMGEYIKTVRKNEHRIVKRVWQIPASDEIKSVGRNVHVAKISNNW